MSRRRNLSTDISTDPKLAELAESGPLPLLLYTWAIPHADDWGRLTGDARQFRLTVCPALDAAAQEVEAALEQIAAAGLWDRYQMDGRWYIAFPPEAWYRHQSYIPASKRQADKSQFPPPPAEAQRTSPHFAADHRRGPQNCAKLRFSFSFSFSFSNESCNRYTTLRANTTDRLRLSSPIFSRRGAGWRWRYGNGPDAQ